MILKYFFRTFIGRLVREVLHVTDAGSSVYVGSQGAWFAPRPPHAEILGPSFVQQLQLALGVPGMWLTRIMETFDTAKPAEADGLSLNPRDFCTKTSHRTSVTYFAVCTLTPSE